MQRSHRRALGYARVSSTEQALGTSLQDQQDVIRADAKKRGLAVAHLYVEAESAIHEKFERREQIQALLAEARDGDLVLVDKLDRWSRDPAFTYASIRDLRAKNVDFFAIGDNCDPSTYEGDTMLNVRVLVAREEHKRIKQRMVGTRKILRDRGYYVEGLVPFGYRRQQVKGAERNALLLDDDRAAVVREVFRLCIKGRSLNEIAAQVEINRDRVHHILHNRAYLGEVRSATGEWIVGRLPKLIEPHEYLAAHEAIEGRRLGERRGHGDSETVDWWLRDLARCALCGSKMSSAYAGPHGEGRRHYFRCYARCTTRFVRVSVAEQACDVLVLHRLVEMREAIAAAATEKPKKPTIARASIEERREKLQKKRARYVEAFSDGAMSRDELRAAMDRLDRERTAIDALAYVAPVVSGPQWTEALRAVSDMRAAWAEATPVERRAIVSGLASSVGLAADAAPVFVWLSVEELARG